MPRDTHRGVEDLRKLAGALDSRDVTDAEFFALPQAEQIRCAKFGIAKAAQKFQLLLAQALQENNERHIRICESSLAELADSEATLDKIASAGG